jgi:hypothetical protein
MTFDFATRHPLPSDDLASRSNRHGDSEVSRIRRDASHLRTQEHDCDYDTQVSNWEDEGGAHPHVSRDIYRGDGVSDPQRFSDHIDAARLHMDRGEYEAAYAELDAATQRFVSYREKLSGSVDASIAHLTTLGCRATPPHPVALPLVKLRRRLAD